MTRLLNKLKARAEAGNRPGCFERMLKENKITQRQYRELLEIKSAWNRGELAVGGGQIADEILIEMGIHVARTTLLGWLGRKGSDVN